MALFTCHRARLLLSLLHAAGDLVAWHGACSERVTRGAREVSAPFLTNLLLVRLRGGLFPACTIGWLVTWLPARFETTNRLSAGYVGERATGDIDGGDDTLVVSRGESVGEWRESGAVYGPSWADL